MILKKPPEKEFSLRHADNQIISKFENHNQFKPVNMNIIPRQKAIPYTKSVTNKANNSYV
jgi:hypothetical protein